MEQSYSLGEFFPFRIHLGCQVCGHRNFIFLYVFVNFRKIKVIRIQLWVMTIMADSAPDCILERCNYEKYHCDASCHRLQQGMCLAEAQLCSWWALPVPFTHCFYHTADTDVFRSQRYVVCATKMHNHIASCCIIHIGYWSVWTTGMMWGEFLVLFFPRLGGETCVVPLLWYCLKVVSIEGAAQKSSATDHVHITFVTGLVPWYLMTIVFDWHLQFA